MGAPANPIASSFPYVALPNTASVNQAGGQGSGNESPALGPTLGGVGSILGRVEQLLSPSPAPSAPPAPPSPAPSQSAASRSSRGLLGGLLNLLGLKQ